MNTISSLDAGTAIEGADTASRLIGLSSEGGFLYDLFAFLEPLGQVIDGAMNILAAIMHVQV